MTMERHAQPGGTLYSTGGNVMVNYSPAEYTLDPSPQYPIGQRQTQSESGIEQPFEFQTEPSKQNHWGQTNVAHFLTNTDSPWDGLHHEMQSNVPFSVQHNRFYPTPVSDCGSHQSAPDSGYVSNSIAHGMHAGNGSEPLAATNVLAEKAGKRAIGPVRGRIPRKTSRPRSTSQPNGSQRIFPFPCPRPNCDKALSCKSAFDKHMRMHDKPFHCEHIGCTYTNGFTTKNDLYRHFKSKHSNGIDPKSKSWICHGKGCKNPSKIWPRYDNFKQHVSKMHPGENVAELVNKSLIDPAKFPDDRVASGGMREAINPLDLNKQVSNPLPVTPELKITTSDATDTAASPAPKMDRNRLSPTSAPQFVKRGRQPLRSPAPQTKPASSPLSGNNVQAGLQVHATASEKQLSPLSPDERINSATSKSGDMVPVGVALNLILGLLNANSASNMGSPGSNNIGSAAQQPMLNLDQSLALKELLERTSLQQTTMNQAPSLRTDSVSNDDEKAEADGWFVCKECDKRVKRQCELTKHMKRHTKPYGCTFSRCNKKFGSKNDWKRHENGQHFQNELWKCPMPVSGSPAGICGHPEFVESEMVDHLVNAHALYKSEALGKTAICHIGRNNQTRYWCGFCGEVKALQVQGLAAWDERFTHIDEHFKNGCKVENWIDDVLHQRKGDVVKEKSKRSRRADGQDATTGMPGASDASSSVTLPGSVDSRKRQRSVSADRSLPANQRRRGFSYQMPSTRGMWLCCACNLGGGASSGITDHCANCDHEKCDNCHRDIN